MSWSTNFQGDPVLGLMYRPAGLTYIAGFLGLFVIGLWSVPVMAAGIVWDELHWRKRRFRPG